VRVLLLRLRELSPRVLLLGLRVMLRRESMLELLG
jgi:hypothetical protein